MSVTRSSGAAQDDLERARVGGGVDAGGPDVRLEEAEEAFCLAGGVELEVNDDIVEVADRPLDALLAYPGLPPGLGDLGIRPRPGCTCQTACG